MTIKQCMKHDIFSIYKPYTFPFLFFFENSSSYTWNAIEK